MKLKRLSISNYKCFDLPGPVEFAAGRNLVVGANNSGKTALLEIAALTFKDHPHRSDNLPPGRPLPPSSSVDISITASGEELRRLMFEAQTDLLVPWVDTKVRHSAETFIDGLFRQPEITISVRRTSASFEPSVYPSSDYGNVPQHNASAIQVTANPLAGSYAISSILNNRSDFGHVAAQHFLSRIYFYFAKRNTPAQSPPGARRVLNSDGSNLPEVVQNLQENGSKFHQYKLLVSRVIPTIRDVSARNTANGMVELCVSPYAPEIDREDLFVSLDHCGSGVGQVLSILYVLVSSREPTVIIIDEPNSYLHPSASRSLMEVVREFGQHQYILSTHSAEVIAGFDPDRVFITRWTNSKADIVISDEDSVSAEKNALAEIGVRLSDIFGMDRVLWVEGITEERCFPEILKTLEFPLLKGTAIIGLPATGDLRGRRRKLVYDIYKKLSETSLLVPTVVGIVFDRDNLGDEEMADLSRESGGILHFIPRRHYENYLLDVAAIANVINSEDVGSAPIAEALVEDWIATHKADAKFQAEQLSRGPNDLVWYMYCNAACLLENLFWDLRKVAFVKARHSFALTQFLLRTRPETFREIGDLVTRIFEAGIATSTVTPRSRANELYSCVLPAAKRCIDRSV